MDSCLIWLIHDTRSRGRRQLAALGARRLSAADPRATVHSGREGTPSSMQGIVSNSRSSSTVTVVDLVTVLAAAPMIQKVTPLLTLNLSSGEPSRVGNDGGHSIQ